MKYCWYLLVVIMVMHLLISSTNATTHIDFAEFDDLLKTQFTSDKRSRSKIPFKNSLSPAHICFFSGYKTSKIYTNTTFTLLVRLNFLQEKSFEMTVKLNTFIYQLKDTIGQRTGLRCDQQRMRLVSHTRHGMQRKLQDGHKLGDYVTIMNNTCQYELRVYKRNGNKKIRFDSIPSVTHYEYVKMSSHVYQPNEPFLDGWQVVQHNPPNKNGLSLAVYVHPGRHQCVISARGTDLTSSLFNNPITDLRLLFTNQAIDTFDSARLLLFYDGKLHIPRQDSIPYVISFTGHSLGAALAESFACVYNAYAVTFDSPGTKHILHNDPSCRRNMEHGYDPKVHIHIYLGAYANLINVANPQTGQVMYLKQFGIGNSKGLTDFFYISSSAAGVYIAACIFANIIDKNMFKLSLWFTIGYFIQESSIVYSLSNCFDLNSGMDGIWSCLISELPFIITLFLLWESISTLADSIERRVCHIVNLLALINIPLISRIIVLIGQKINFKRVIWRFTVLCIYLVLAFFITIGIPLCCYLWWLKSSHSVNKFVESFNPDDGKPYQGESIESTLWPTLVDYVTKIFSRQFLLFILIIQSMKLVAFHLFPSDVSRWFRLNLILILFGIFFNIDSVENLIFMYILFLFVVFSTSQQANEHYIRNIVCATSGLLAMMQIMNERHDMNKFYCEVVGCPLMLIPFIRRLHLF